ncbi:hypothetical protein DFP72DRAFT_1043355 [Ephemerocybe angulata]|uniref:Uncharacterized protein n=1 Tax=Ephemerocybe angulata TaxID=980116 RepID=A0A8H6I5F5_9AGAR|nr:hypothetical protein DFP72DRAFT_1043355 [Tulosesus angulatus]
MEPPCPPPNPPPVVLPNPVPFPTAPVLTVHRARKGVNNEVNTYPYPIDINAWIRDYRYLGVVRKLEASDNRLQDPNCVVVLDSFELAKAHIPYLLALELRTLACYHARTIWQQISCLMSAMYLVEASLWHSLNGSLTDQRIRMER